MSKSSFWSKVSDFFKNLTPTKVFLVLGGLVVLMIKFRSLLINLLVSDGKRIAKDAHDKDKELKKQHDEFNAKADKLVEDAKKLAKEEHAVDNDWYKNE